MLSIIALRETLHELFAKTPEVIDVYATTDFSLEQDRPIFTVLHNGDLDVPQFYFKLIKLYPDVFAFYATRNPMDSCLSGCRLIWRKGKWYV